MQKKPNILFFFTDDQRFDTIGVLGNDEISTPNLDRLVERGLSFTSAHIPGGTVGAVCMPSRAMLHTGKTLFHLDTQGRVVPHDHATLGECLRKSGYETFGTGKWHNGRSAYARSFSCGDEIFFGGMNDHWNVPAYRFDPSGKYESKFPFIADPGNSNEVRFREFDHIHPGRHSTELFVDASVNYLQNRNSTDPFFMYVSLMAPHDPRSMPEKFLQMYDPEKIKLPENFLPEHPIDTGALKIRDEMLAGFPRDPDEVKRHIAEYYAMITHLDAELGRLLEVLEQSGEMGNTIIVFSGDNGLAVGQHGLMGKQNLYDHSVRVPLVFAGPGIPRGSKRFAMVYLLDIFPTLCELTGTDIPESVEGKSFYSCFKNQQAKMREKLFLAYTNSIRGVRKQSFKLIEYACGQTQLFDLDKDPLEMKNLAGESHYKSIVADLRNDLIEQAREWDDQDHPAGKAFWETRADLLQ